MNLVSVARTQSLASTRSQGLALVLVALPIVCFTVLLLAYVVDVPWMDDVDTFLNFIVDYIDAGSVSQKFDLLIRPNNEHRILIAKLITVVMYKLTGTVNFRWLIFAAYVFLLGTLYLFYRVFKTINLSLLAFAPVPFLLLQPQYHLTSTWAITALQHQVVVFMAFATMYLLAGVGRNRFVAATGVQLLASFSMSNGLFGWVAGAVVLALQRHWGRLGIWLTLGAATIMFYFHDFQNPQGNESSFTFFLKHPHLVFLGFFTFTGALFDFISTTDIVWRSVLPTLAGFVLIPTMLWLLWRMNEPLLRRYANTYIATDRTSASLWKRRYFFTGCYAFLMVNAVIVAFFRPRFGYSVMLISNYMLYPAVLVVLLYINVLSERRNERSVNRWIRVGLAVSIVVWGLSYVMRLPKIAFRKQQLLTNAFNQKHNNVGLGATVGTPFAELVNRAMTETVKRGIYHYPDAFYTPYEQQLSDAKAKSDGKLDVAINGQATDYSYIVNTVEGTTPVLVRPAALIVQSKQHTYLFASEVPYDLATFWSMGAGSTIKAEVINATLYPNTYQVGVLIPSPDGQPVRFSNRRITITQETK
ncbi:hypothetical protein ACFSUS_08475 [Spirosoma soli]|uniref:Glycosyltransferase RgtA/B/C/D-like domain-containing protein n=1 Tax=Spirosoma soli TaxID=1770529 RepID=A0ABW5M0U8_9BACT